MRLTSSSMGLGGAAFKSDGTGTFLTQPDTSAPVRIPSIIVSFCNRFKDMTPISITCERLLTRLPGTALTRILTNRNSSCQLAAWGPLDTTRRGYYLDSL